jgi:hypothetical protein
MKAIRNSFRQVNKHEDIQDAATMLGLICLFGLAIIASAAPLV